jgi:hypothetical protein
MDGIRAWLITWDWTSDSVAVVDRIAAVLPPRWSEERVGDFMEQLYAHGTSSVDELAAIAKRPKTNPYRVRQDGPYLTCGHHPWLTARKVSKLKVARDHDGFEVVSWLNPNTYRLKADASGTEVVVKGQEDSVRRIVKGPLSRDMRGSRGTGSLHEGSHAPAG